MYVLLLNSGETSCKSCSHGTFTDQSGAQHVCRACGGKGKIPIRELVNQIIGKLRPALSRWPIVSTEYSLMLKFVTPEDCLLSLRALRYHGIRGRVILDNTLHSI